MENITSKHTQLSIPIELRFTAIPTRWTVKVEKLSCEPCLVPSVNQHVDRKLAHVDEPEEIRREFFRQKFDSNESARDFLNGVGVWSAASDSGLSIDPDGRLLNQYGPLGVEGMLLNGGFGYRNLHGYATIETLVSLKEEQAYWRGLCCKNDGSKLREAFGRGIPSKDARPYDRDNFAFWSGLRNTLEVHMEWQKRHPRAIIQPITGRELLIALAWLDLLSGAEFKVCQNDNCGIEFTGRGRKYCSWQCEHATTVRTWRKNKRAKSTAEDD